MNEPYANVTSAGMDVHRKFSNVTLRDAQGDVMKDVGLRPRLSNCFKVDKMRQVLGWVKTNKKDADLVSLMPFEHDNWWETFTTRAGARGRRPDKSSRQANWQRRDGGHYFAKRCFATKCRQHIAWFSTTLKRMVNSGSCLYNISIRRTFSERTLICILKRSSRCSWLTSRAFWPLLRAPWPRRRLTCRH